MPTFGFREPEINELCAFWPRVAEVGLAGTGRGAVGKVAAVGEKDRATKRLAAKVVESTDKPTLQGFVVEHTAPRATVYSDEASAYEGHPFALKSVKHGVAELRSRDGAYERRGILLEHAETCPQGHVSHDVSEAPKSLRLEFAGKHHIRDLYTAAQMTIVAAGLVGKRLMYSQLISENGLDSAAALNRSGSFPLILALFVRRHGVRHRLG